MLGHFSTLCMKGLTHFMPLVSFNTPRIHQKTFFSGGIEKGQWREMD